MGVRQLALGRQLPGVAAACRWRSVAPRACTVGTFQETSPTSVEPIILAPRLESWAAPDGAERHVRSGLPARAEGDWRYPASGERGLDLPGGPRGPRRRRAAGRGGRSCRCIAVSSGAFASRLETAEITWVGHGGLSHQRGAVGDLAHALEQRVHVGDVAGAYDVAHLGLGPAPRSARCRRHPDRRSGCARRSAYARACSSRRHSSARPHPARSGPDAGRRRHGWNGRGR
jgi:hypothetical protein